MATAEQQPGPEQEATFSHSEDLPIAEDLAKPENNLPQEVHQEKKPFLTIVKELMHPHKRQQILEESGVFIDREKADAAKQEMNSDHPSTSSSPEESDEFKKAA